MRLLGSVADGTMSDLNSQISSAEAKRYTLVDAVAINDNGQVVAQGYLSSDKDETTQSFLLTPLSPSISAVVTGTLGMNDWYITPTTVSWIVTGHPAPTKSGCGKVSYQDHLFLRGPAGPRYWRGNYPVYLVMITESLTSQRLSPNTLRSYLNTFP